MPPAEPVRTIWSDDEPRAQGDSHDTHRDEGWSQGGFDAVDEPAAPRDDD